jgi:DNA-binding transcriptional LysR family regulator
MLGQHPRKRYLRRRHAARLSELVQNVDDPCVRAASLGRERRPRSANVVGVHVGILGQRDMTAVRVTREQRAAVVAAPSYFDAHPKPKKPSDVTAHRCVVYRMGPDGPIYRWEFEKRGKPVSVSVSGPVIVSDAQFMIRAALDGVGLAYILEDYVADDIERGALVRVLDDWCPPFEGYFLYYPSRRQQSPALQALIAALRV